jgi:hypothetical protein
MEKKPYQCLYVVKYKDTNLVKIGVSNNWYERAKALQVGLKTTPLAVVITESNVKAEKELHKKFEEYRLPGSEYFFFDQELLGKVVVEACKYGNTLSDWRKHPPRPPCPELALLEQDYIEVSATVLRELFRQIRLNYRQRGSCILDYMNEVWPESVVRYFTVYLDIQVQKRKIKYKNNFCTDWAIRVDVVEDYLLNFFKFIRVYTYKNLCSPAEFKPESFTYTTLNSCTPIEYNKLPLLARIIFERTWHSYDLYQQLFSVHDRVKRHDRYWFEHYLESNGPLYYSKGALLPIPRLAAKV